MRRWVIFSLFFVSLASEANTEHDREVCKVRYEELRDYLTSANGFLWEMYDQRLISYDDFRYGQSQTVLNSRNSMSMIRNRAYVGTAEECDYWADEARKQINEVMEPYRQLKLKNESNPRN